MYIFNKPEIYSEYEKKRLRMKENTCPTNEGNKTFNVHNVALIENIKVQTVVTLNVKKAYNQNIFFTVNLPWADVAGAIGHLAND